MRFIFLLIVLCPVLLCAQVKNPYTAIDKQAAAIPADKTASVASMAAYIKAAFPSEKEQIRAIFYWTASNISYDVENMYAINFNETSDEKIAKALKTHKGVCIHYAELFNALANQAGIKSVVVEGYTKQNGFADYIPHAWCAAKVEGKWYIFDPTWGSGYIANSKFVRKMNDGYYKADPAKMIASHMPFDYLWQFLNYPVTNQEFYTGKTKVDKSKPYFDFEAEISRYENLSEVEKLEATAARIEKNGVKNGMIFDRLSGKKREAEYAKQNKIATAYNEVVQQYNEAISGVNDFINFRNRQFKPAVSDDVLLTMIGNPIDKLAGCNQMLDAIGPVGAANLSNVSNLRLNIAKAQKEAEEHLAFVREYLKKGKSARKSMFYKKTFLGLPVD